MASRAIAAQSANVVRLPTAAPRQVQNNRFRDQFKAAQALRQARPWPGEYKSPRDLLLARAASQEPQLQKSPELFALLSIMSAFPADRLDALAASAELMLLMDRDNEDAKAGHAFVMRAIEKRRACEVLAKGGR